MNIPGYMEERVAETIAIETDGADKRRQWAVILGLAPKLDGDQWCILWGEDLMSGVAGFGDTPAKAISAFEQAMYEKVNKGNKI